MLVSIIIRTYNEQRYLEQLLDSINRQRCRSVEYEVIIVDSGSTDQTLTIASRHHCRITHISKKEFTFGRSLNNGCQFARGDILVFISGHCIPVDDVWLEELCAPLLEGKASYVYGRQIGKDTTKYSETRHFQKWFPDYPKLPQQGFFCNNANAALTRSAWQRFRFDEDLTGLEDMHLAKRLLRAGENIGYVSTAAVYHIHDESWRQVRVRYEREAYALHRIMAEVHFTLADFFRYFASGVWSDFSSAMGKRMSASTYLEIILFRFNQYWGSYRGSSETRKLSVAQKKNYFFPKDLERTMYEGRSATTYESQQRKSQRQEFP